MFCYLTATADGFRSEKSIRDVLIVGVNLVNVVQIWDVDTLRQNNAVEADSSLAVLMEND
jgi:hypothetical protein